MITTHVSERAGLHRGKENKLVEMGLYQIIWLLCCFSVGKKILSYILVLTFLRLDTKYFYYAGFLNMTKRLY